MILTLLLALGSMCFPPTTSYSQFVNTYTLTTVTTLTNSSVSYQWVKTSDTITIVQAESQNTTFTNTVTMPLLVSKPITHTFAITSTQYYIVTNESKQPDFRWFYIWVNESVNAISQNGLAIALAFTMVILACVTFFERRVISKRRIRRFGYATWNIVNRRAFRRTFGIAIGSITFLAAVSQRTFSAIYNAFGSQFLAAFGFFFVLSPFIYSALVMRQSHGSSRILEGILGMLLAIGILLILLSVLS